MAGGGYGFCYMSNATRNFAWHKPSPAEVRTYRAGILCVPAERNGP